MKLWMACTISTNWKRSGPTMIDNQRCHLVLETKVMKVYVNQYICPIYCSFPNLISQMPAIEYHTKKIFEWAREYKFGDFSRVNIPSEELMVLSTSPTGSPKGLDDIAKQNLDNMMQDQLLTFTFYFKVYVKTMGAFGFLPLVLCYFYYYCTLYCNKTMGVTGIRPQFCVVVFSLSHVQVFSYKRKFHLLLYIRRLTPQFKSSKFEITIKFL